MASKEHLIAFFSKTRPGIDHTSLTLATAVLIDNKNTAQKLIDEPLLIQTGLGLEDMKIIAKNKELALMNITKHLKVN